MIIKKRKIRKNKKEIILMKQFEKGTIQYLVALIISISVCGMILYPIFDLILCKFITNSVFEYSIHEHIIQPILFGFIFGFVSWLVDKKK